MPCRLCLCSVILSAALLPGALAAADDSAELRLRIAPNEVQRYAWTITATSDSRGNEKGRPFVLTGDSAFTMTLVLRGLPAKPGVKTDKTRVAARIQDLSYSDKRAVDTAKTELTVSKGRIKCVENGKVVMDSENDIGLDRLVDYQQHIKSIENGEMRATLDAAGRQSEVEGEPALVDTLKGGGAEGIFPILSARETKVGESWEDSFSMTRIGDFKLARPAVVRSKMTFAKWVTRDDKKLAQLEIASAWDNQPLKGEHPEGLLVEITSIEGRGEGTCLFDPATGRFVEGAVNFGMKYHVTGEREGQTTALDVAGKTRFSFAAQPGR
ncbi:MAG: hypothetical protein NTW87_17995 [Planctomycetota bacterium]|nr:hypothetical protein [Planctomycetota bacterium]